MAVCAEPTTPPAPHSSPFSPPRSEIHHLHSSGQQCKFTPDISKRAPRAWERKPATPFAPRSDSHKIWKRCKQRLDRKCAAEGRESWRTVKRMRVGKAARGGEDADTQGSTNFIATEYDDIRGTESERPRKTGTGVVCGGMHRCTDEDRAKSGLVTGVNATALPSRAPEVSEEFGSAVSQPHEEDEDGNATAIDHVQQIVPPTALTIHERRPSAGRIDATSDGSSSPVPSRTKRARQSSVVGEEDERAAAEGSQVEEKQQLQNAGNEVIVAEKQTTVGSCQKAPSCGDAVVGQAPNFSFASEGEDTEYLHAFITRAKAKRAAKTMMSPQGQAGTGKPRPTASSPQTRSRTALATLDRNSPSPTKITKPDVETEELDQNRIVLPDMETASPLRKSSRNRPPRPQAHQAATPSTITFRRSNGTEFVFLQKTEAQQIAMATRSNTRRNKGEALQPKMKLKTLSSGTPSSPAKGARKRKNRKQVSWDEGLAYFAPQAEVQPLGSVEEQRGQQTPVKRSSRLAGGKGTPAPKKQMAEAAMHILTPTSRTRARTKGRT